MIRSILGGMAGLCLLVVAVPVRAGTIVDITLEPVKDNTLYQDAEGDISNGIGDTILAGQSNLSGTRRGLLAFDTSAIPNGAMIQSVSLSLYSVIAAPGSGNRIFTLHRALSDWGEGTSNAGFPAGQGAQATVNDATWLHNFYNTSLWTTPGGDFDATASGSAVIGEATFANYLFASTPGLVGDVQSWVDSPGANFGWVLRGEEGAGGTARAFTSHESEAERPTLRISYIIPEPAAAWLLIAAAGAALRRRRSAA